MLSVLILCPDIQAKTSELNFFKSQCAEAKGLIPKLILDILKFGV